MPVIAACRCGQRFLAEDRLLGKQVPCPACGSPLTIPSAPAAQPAVRPMPSPPTSLPMHRAPAAATSGTATQVGWILGIGGGAALVVMVIVILIAASGGGKGDLANAPRKSAGESLPGPPAPARKTSPFSRTAPAAPPAAPTAPSAPKVARSSLKVAEASTDSPDGGQPTDAPDFGQPTPGAKPRPTEHSVVALPSGLTAWHEGKSGTLTGILNPKADENPVGHLSWMTGLLPYLGHQKTFERLDLAKPLTDSANLEVAETIIPEFQNPQDNRKKWDGYPFEGLALTHFVGMSGVEDARNVAAAQLPRSDPRAGIFGYEAVARPAEITDGTSHTIMVVGSGRLANPWIMGGGATIRGAREPLFDKVSGLGAKGVSSGTLAVMADGSVRHIPANISPTVFKAMCTIHGAESVDVDQHARPFHLEDLK